MAIIGMNNAGMSYSEIIHQLGFHRTDDQQIGTNINKPTMFLTGLDLDDPV